jgi:hypothetical protein
MSAVRAGSEKFQNMRDIGEAPFLRKAVEFSQLALVDDLHPLAYFADEVMAP